MYTPYHNKYWAAALTCTGAAGSVDSLSRSIAGAKVDLNPHQVDAALFAARSPLSKAVILADEVGLGKTIEDNKDSGRIATLTGILGRKSMEEKRVVQWSEVDL